MEIAVLSILALGVLLLGFADEAPAAVAEAPASEDTPEPSAPAEPSDVTDAIPSKEEDFFDPTEDGDLGVAEATKEKPETPEAPKEETTPKETFKHDAQLLSIADELGMSRDDVSAMGEQQLINHLLGVTGPAQQQAALPKPSTFEFTKKMDRKDEVFDSALYDFMDDVQGLNTHYGKKMDDLTVVLGSIIKHLNDQSVATESSAYDGWVSGLDKKYEGLLGTGATSDLDPNSEQFANRTKHRELLNGLSRAMPATPKAKLMMNALHAAFADDLQKMERKSIADKLETRSGQVVARPTHREPAKPESGEKMVEKNLAARMKEKGMFSEDDELGLEF